MEKVSKLVEVVGPCKVDVLVDLHLSAFRNSRNTKNDNRNVLAEIGMSAYSMSSRKKPLGTEA
jgi:hypothetical protein